MDKPHDCPGGCGKKVPYAKLSCAPCWARLPQPLKSEIRAAYRARRLEPLRHLRAVSAALGWYRDQ